MKTHLVFLLMSLVFLSGCPRSMAPSSSGDISLGDVHKDGSTGDIEPGKGDLTSDSSGNTVADLKAGDLPPGDDWVGQPPCCTTDLDCGENQVCAVSDFFTEAQCRPRPGSRHCYRAEDCDQWYVCVSAELCECLDDCRSQPGICSPLDAGCCLAEADCPDGTSCISGTCMPDPTRPGLTCWQDSQCGQGEVCVDARVCPCDADCDSLNEEGYCQAASLADCIKTYSGCGCEPGCMDGWGVTYFYPQSAGTFPRDTVPPQELLEVSVASYTCSICTCEEIWMVSQDGEWVDYKEAGAEGFCVYLQELDQQCSGCLTTWWGGAG